MGARLVGDSEVTACLSPFVSMRSNAVPASAELCEQMSQLVSQGAVDFRHILLAQARIQRNEFTAIIRASRGAEESRIPFHMH